MPQGPIPSQMFTQVPGKTSTPLVSGVPANYVSTLSGQSFVGANQTGVTTTVGLATTYVGLCLSNPNASTVNLVVGRVTGIVNVAFAALTGIGLAVGSNASDVTHTTAITPHNALSSSSVAAQAKLDSSTTLPAAPVYISWLAESPAATSGVSFFADFQGGLILPPGGYAIIATTAASPPSGFFGSFQWYETPV